MKISINKPSLCLILIFLGFLFATYKNDTNLLINSEWWGDVSYHPVVNFLKNNNILFGIFFILVGLLIFLNNMKKRINLGLIFILYIYISIFFTIRVFFESVVDGFKIFQALVIYIVFLLALVFLKSNKDDEFFNIQLIKSLYYCSFFYTILSFLNYIFGYGFAANADRYFGVTIHPNFSGVQQGIMIIILLYFFIKEYSIKNFLILILSLYLLLLTGSRTGIFLFAIGSLTLFIMERTISNFKKISISIITIILSIIYFIYFSISDRVLNGENTRQEAWESMLLLIIEKPILGHGGFVGYSENSYMRSMVAYGIPLSIIYFSILIYVGYKLFKLAKYNQRMVLFFALYLSLMFSAILEGFIVDLWSMPKFILIILIFVASCFNIKHKSS